MAAAVGGKVEKPSVENCEKLVENCRAMWKSTENQAIADKSSKMRKMWKSRWKRGEICGKLPWKTLFRGIFGRTLPELTGMKRKIFYEKEIRSKNAK